jgi:hypothetical protein
MHNSNDINDGGNDGTHDFLNNGQMLDPQN